MLQKKKFVSVSWHKNCDGLADLLIYILRESYGYNPFNNIKKKKKKKKNKTEDRI